MQTSLFGREDDRQNQELQLSPAEKWDMDAAKHSLDELFKVSSQYRSSDSYMRMLDFINQFPYIAPFNAMLAHIQMPGARYVLPPRKWYQYFGRVIKSEARPIVILRTMGPVDFVFDVSDTEGEPLPADIEKRSMEIIAEELGEIQLDPEKVSIVKRVIHTSADFDYARTLHFSNGVVEKALEALKPMGSIEKQE